MGRTFYSERGNQGSGPGKNLKIRVTNTDWDLIGDRKLGKESLEKHQKEVSDKEPTLPQLLLIPDVGHMHK